MNISLGLDKKLAKRGKPQKFALLGKEGPTLQNLAKIKCLGAL